MQTQPSLATDRLILRPLTQDDAPALAAHCAPIEIAMQTRTIPHPYPPEAAPAAIERFTRSWTDGTGAVFAATLRDTGRFIGVCGLHVFPEQHHAEIGYTISMDHWGRGYATEAVLALLRYGFEGREPPLNKLWAGWYIDNPASGRVLEKVGMKQEGVQRQHAYRFGRYRDVVLVGMLREEWIARRGETGGTD